MRWKYFLSLRDRAKNPFHLVFSHSANIWVWLRARCQQQVYTAFTDVISNFCEMFCLFLAVDLFWRSASLLKFTENERKRKKKKRRNFVCTMNIKLTMRVILYYLSIESARVVWSFCRVKIVPNKTLFVVLFFVLRPLLHSLAMRVNAIVLPGNLFAANSSYRWHCIMFGICINLHKEMRTEHWLEQLPFVPCAYTPKLRREKKKNERNEVCKMRAAAEPGYYIEHFSVWNIKNGIKLLSAKYNFQSACLFYLRTMTTTAKQKTGESTRMRKGKRVRKGNESLFR